PRRPGPRPDPRGPGPAGAPGDVVVLPAASVTPPAVGGGGGPCFRTTCGITGRTAYPCRFTCSDPRLPTKKTPQFSMPSAMYTSPLANVMMKLSYCHEIENVSGTISGSASGTARNAPFATVLTGTLRSAFMNQCATST